MVYLGFRVYLARKIQQVVRKNHMARDHLLVIDQGTTSTRAVVYDANLKHVGQGQAEVLPTFPQSGWVEHDPMALISSVESQVSQALKNSGIKTEQVAA